MKHIHFFLQIFVDPTNPTWGIDRPKGLYSNDKGYGSV